MNDRHAQRDAHRGHGHGSDPLWPQEIDLRAVERREQINRERHYMHEQKIAQQQHVSATMKKLAREQHVARQEQERRKFLAEERLRAHCPERAHPDANVKPTPELVQAAVRRTGITPDLQRLSTLSAAEREEEGARTPAQRDIDQVVRWSHQEEQDTIAEADADITARHKHEREVFCRQADVDLTARHKREREEHQDLAAQHRVACATARADIGAGVTPANTPNVAAAGGDDDDSSSGSGSDGPQSKPLQRHAARAQKRHSPERRLERQAEHQHDAARKEQELMRKKYARQVRRHGIVNGIINAASGGASRDDAIDMTGASTPDRDHAAQAPPGLAQSHADYLLSQDDHRPNWDVNQYDCKDDLNVILPGLLTTTTTNDSDGVEEPWIQGSWDLSTLRVICERSGLAKSGTKPEIMARLQARSKSVRATLVEQQREMLAQQVDYDEQHDPSIHGVEGLLYQKYQRAAFEAVPPGHPTISQRARPLSAADYRAAQQGAMRRVHEHYEKQSVDHACDECKQPLTHCSCPATNDRRRKAAAVPGGTRAEPCSANDAGWDCSQCDPRWNMDHEHHHMDGNTRHHMVGDKLAFQPFDCDGNMWYEYNNGLNDLSIAEAVKRSKRFDPIMLVFRKHAHWVAVTTWKEGDDFTIEWPRWDTKSADFLRVQYKALGLTKPGNKNAMIEVLKKYVLKPNMIISAPDRIGVVHCEKYTTDAHSHHEELVDIANMLYKILYQIAQEQDSVAGHQAACPRSHVVLKAQIGKLVGMILGHPDTAYLTSIANKVTKDWRPHLMFIVSECNRAIACHADQLCSECCTIAQPHHAYIDTRDDDDNVMASEVSTHNAIASSIDAQHIAAGYHDEPQGAEQHGAGQLPADYVPHPGAISTARRRTTFVLSGAAPEGEPQVEADSGKPAKKHNMRNHRAAMSTSPARTRAAARRQLAANPPSDHGSNSSESESESSDDDRRKKKRKKKRKDSDSDTDGDSSDSDTDSNDDSDGPPPADGADEVDSEEDSGDDAHHDRSAKAAPPSPPDDGGSSPSSSDNDDDGDSSLGGGEKRKMKGADHDLSRIATLLDTGGTLTTENGSITEDERMRMVFKELNRLSYEIATAEQTTRKYAKHQRKALKESRKEADEISYEDLASSKSSKTTAAKVRAKCKKVQAEMTAIIRNCYDQISTLLLRAYNVPLQRSSTHDYKTVAELTAKDCKLHHGITTGDSNSERAYETAIVLQSICFQNPKQTWALIPVLLRMQSEIRNRERWSPTRLSKLFTSKRSMFKDLPYLRDEYIQQTSTLYDLFYKCDKTQTQKATKMLRFESTDGMSTVTVHGEKSDGISLVNWWYHKHLKTGYKDEDAILNTFLYSFSAFASGGITKTCNELEDLINQAKRMGVKLPWARVITRSARVISQRHTSFLKEMQKWEKHTGRRGEADQLSTQCINVLPTFYATVRAMAEMVQADSLTDHIATVKGGSRVFYTMHKETLSGGAPSNNHHQQRGGGRGKGGKDRPGGRFQKSQAPQDKTPSTLMCQAKTCKIFLPQGMVDKLGLKADGDGMCRNCFEQMLNTGQVSLKNGGTRHKLQKNKELGLTKKSRAYIAHGFTQFTEEAALKLGSGSQGRALVTTTKEDPPASGESKKEKNRKKREKQKEKKAAAAATKNTDSFVTKEDMVKLVGLIRTENAAPAARALATSATSKGDPAVTAWDSLLTSGASSGSRVNMMRGCNALVPNELRNACVPPNYSYDSCRPCPAPRLSTTMTLSSETTTPCTSTSTTVPGSTDLHCEETLSDSSSPPRGVTFEVDDSLEWVKQPDCRVHHQAAFAAALSGSTTVSSPTTTPLGATTTPVKTSPPTDGQPLQFTSLGELSAELLHGRSMLSSSAPPRESKYSYFRDGCKYVEFMIDSASTDNIASTALGGFLTNPTASNLSITGIQGGPQSADLRGNLHIACFDDTAVGEIDLAEVHTLSGNNANLISEWFLTHECGLTIIKKGTRGIEIYGTDANGFKTRLPVTQFIGGKCYMVRAIVGNNRQDAVSTANDIVTMAKRGLEWRWDGFGKEGFLTSALQVSMWTRLGSKDGGTPPIERSLKWVGGDGSRAPTSRERLFLDRPAESKGTTWPSTSLAQAGRAFLSVSVSPNLDPVSLGVALTYGREATKNAGRTAPGSMREISCVEQVPEYDQCQACPVTDPVTDARALAGVGDVEDATTPVPPPRPTPRSPDEEDPVTSVAEDELEAAKYARMVYDSYDTDVGAVKNTAGKNAQKLTWMEFHKRFGHAGPGSFQGHKCKICALIKGKFHRIYTKRDPFKPLRPGFEFACDIVTFNVDSRHGRRYCLVTRDLATGWYAPLVFLELRSNAAVAFGRMVKALRADPLYKQFEYPLMQRLRHDQAGEFTGQEWVDMCKELGIHPEITPAEDKRGSAHAEAAVKHIESMVKAILLETLCPPIFWEEAASQARFLRNLLPLTRNIISKDGDTLRPEEQITAGLVSRTACNRLLAEVVPVGSPCLVYSNKILGSDLKHNKAMWMMALGQSKGMNLFQNLVNGATKFSKSFSVMQLPEDQNCYEFLRRKSPSRNDCSLTIEEHREEHDIVVLVDGLDAQYKNALPARVTNVTRAHGTAVPQVIVMDKGSGRKYVQDQDHELVPLLANGEETGTIITTMQPEPAPARGVTQRERRIAEISNDPGSIVGESLYKRFVAEADGQHLKDYKGVVHAFFTIPGVCTMWTVMFEDNETENFNFEQVIHHVVDGYVSLIGSDEPYRRTDESSTASDVAHMRTPIGTLDGIADPYQAVPRDDLNIDVDRKVLFTEIHSVQNAAGIYKVPSNTSWTKALTNMGIPHTHHKLYKKWLGTSFGPGAPADREGVISYRFPTKWEGASVTVKKWLKKGARLPVPEGPSWVQWCNEQRRRREAAKPPISTTAMVMQALAYAAAGAHATAKRVIHHQLEEETPYYDVNPENVGMPATAMETKRTANAMISAGNFKEYMGDRLSKQELEKLTDSTTGHIIEPKNWDDVLARADKKEWEMAKKIEMDSIENHKVFSQPMRISQIRKLGIFTRPVDCGGIYSVKSDPAGGYSKHKYRFVLKGHPGNVTQGVNYWETFSATPNAATERILMFLVAHLGLHWAALDVSTAYLFGKVEERERVPCRMPKELRTYDPVTGEETFPILIGALYGHPVAGLRWAKRRDTFLTSGAFNNKIWSCRKCRYDGALFVFTISVLVACATGIEVPTPAFNKSDIETGKLGAKHQYAGMDKTPDGKYNIKMYRAFASVFTDDVSIVAEREEDIKYIKDALRSEFGIKDCDPQHMLGLLRTRVEDDTVDITMSSYIHETYEIFKDSCPKRAPKTPLPPGTFLSRGIPGTEGEVDPLAFPLYSKAVGCLLWIMRMARPDICCAVHMLCKMMSGPTQEAWDAAMHVIAYLEATKHMGVKMTKTDTKIPELSSWYDASNKADQGSKGRTIGGFIIKLGNSPIEWKSGNLTHASQSAQHSEYQAMAMCSKATRWIMNLLGDIGLKSWVSMPIPVLGDNNAAISLAKNDILTAGNRFYTPDLHFCKEMHEQGLMCYRKVKSEDNISDSMTKMVTTQIHQRHVLMINGYEQQPPIPGPPPVGGASSTSSSRRSRMGG